MSFAKLWDLAPGELRRSTNWTRIIFTIFLRKVEVGATVGVVSRNGHDC